MDLQKLVVQQTEANTHWWLLLEKSGGECAREEWSISLISQHFSLLTEELVLSHLGVLMELSICYMPWGPNNKNNGDISVSENQHYCRQTL